jgi:hypothetical protein
MFKRLRSGIILLATLALISCGSVYKPEMNLDEMNSAAVLPKIDRQSFGNFLRIVTVSGQIYPAGKNRVEIDILELSGITEYPRFARFWMECDLESGRKYQLDGKIKNESIQVWLEDMTSKKIASRIYDVGLSQDQSGGQLPSLRKSK